jgi:hypothetical protein
MSTQHPYLQRKNLYPKTQPGEPIKYYPNTVKLAGHCGHCAGCGETPTRVDSYYNFELCAKCDADSVAQGIADHVFHPNG